MYMSSVARQVAWRQIERSLENPEEIVQFRQNLSAFHYYVSESGEVLFEQVSDQIMLDNQIVESARTSAQSYVTKVFGESGSPYQKSENEELASIYRQLRNLSRAGRQETRLALLMQLILESPHRTFKIFDLYTDRGQYTRQVIALLRSVFQRPDFELTPDAIEEVIAAYVPRFYSMSYYGNRGVLLEKLAKNLSPYKKIVRAVYRKFESSRSRDVLENSVAIRRALAGNSQLRKLMLDDETVDANQNSISRQDAQNPLRAQGEK
ncbi:hypothetical protein HAD_02845 [Hyphomonas adhaerens MHS-3]|uniref:Uncharacterized protein n=2 Tax=Hyphomonas adhaerens TaxID=81029 RepID=A0A069E3P0_9PROT|nr:hypothetical protein HAD_02845 [Hyphomonas adhaerens MHS-3]